MQCIRKCPEEAYIRKTDSYITVKTKKRFRKKEKQNQYIEELTDKIRKLFEYYSVTIYVDFINEETLKVRCDYIEFAVEETMLFVQIASVIQDADFEDIELKITFVDPPDKDSTGFSEDLFRKVKIG